MLFPMLSVFLLTAPPAPPAVVKAEPDAKLTEAFRQTDGWVGGDGAFSVRLSEKRTLWLFSDSWVGRVRDGKRKGVAMVNNAVGVQDGTGPGAKFTFFTQQNAKGKPVAFFVPPDGKGWFWLFAGHAAKGKLYVFLPRFEKADGAPGFGFKAVDLWLGTVSNPDAEPTKWKIDYAKVPFASFDGKRKFSFGSAVLTAGDETYVYGYEEVPGKPFPTRKLLVARVPKEQLADFDQWRFFSKGEWKPDVKDATPQAGGLGAEFSVSYVPGLKAGGGTGGTRGGFPRPGGYALVTTENGLSARIVGRFAPSPTGPWSEPVLLYTCPEMRKDRKLFTYAGKAHPHLAGENELVVSYAVNSGDLAQVINDAELYWPNFVRVQLK